MSTIQTKHIGEITIDETQLITFPTGMPGFIDETTFVLLNIPGNSIFQVLQSTTNPDLAFIVTNPYHFYKDYVFELDANIIETLQITTEKDVVVLSIVTLQEPFATSTLNLKAPIIIHSHNQIGKQYIIHNDEHTTKAPIHTDVSKKVEGEERC